MAHADRRSAGLLLILTIAALPCLVADAARATTAAPIEVDCPVCGLTKVGGTEVGSYTTGGQDADLLAHTVGEPVIPLFPITCPRCHYSGYQSDFDPGETKLAPAEREKLRAAGALKPMEPIDPKIDARTIPARVRYDLLAQTYALRGKTSHEVAFAHLRASWSERIENTPSAVLDEAGQAARRAADEVKEPPAEYADYDAKHDTRGPAANAKALTAALNNRPEKLRAGELLKRLDSLREHGDDAEIELLLPQLKPMLPAATYERYAKAIGQSIRLEHEQQAKAAALFEKAIAEPAPKPENGEEPQAGWDNFMRYITGELHRRLGHDAEAKKHLAALKDVRQPEWVAEVSRKQLAKVGG